MSDTYHKSWRDLNSWLKGCPRENKKGYKLTSFHINYLPLSKAIDVMAEKNHWPEYFQPARFNNLNHGRIYSWICLVLLIFALISTIILGSHTTNVDLFELPQMLTFWNLKKLTF